MRYKNIKEHIQKICVLSWIMLFQSCLIVVWCFSCRVFTETSKKLSGEATTL